MLTEEQLNYLKKEEVSKFPKYSIQILNQNKKKYLIINLSKFSQTITKLDFLNILVEFKKLKWNFIGSLYPYVYFQKKENIFKRLVKK